MPMQLLERLCSADMPVTIDVHEDRSCTTKGEQLTPVRPR
jgi:hypothetical protein